MINFKKITAALALSLLASGAAMAQEVTLRLRQFLPPQGTIPVKAIGPGIKKIEAESSGPIKIQMFSSMQLGGTPPKLFDQARGDTADVTWMVLGYTPGCFNKTEVFELPFITGLSSETSSKALWAYVQANAQDEFKDVHLLTVPWEVTPALKIAELLRNHTSFAGNNGLYVTTFALSMNKAAYNKLPADLKKVIDNNPGLETAALFGRAMGEGDKTGRAVADQAGNSIVTLDLAETQRWRRRAAAVEPEWVADVKSKGIDGAKLAADAHAWMENHTK